MLNKNITTILQRKKVSISYILTYLPMNKCNKYLYFL